MTDLAINNPGLFVLGTLTGVLVFNIMLSVWRAATRWDPTDREDET